MGARKVADGHTHGWTVPIGGDEVETAQPLPKAAQPEDVPVLPLRRPARPDAVTREFTTDHSQDLRT